MTFAEFIARAASASAKDKCLAALFFEQRYRGGGPLSTRGIREILVRARVSGARSFNVADLIAKCGPRVDSELNQNRVRVWRITDAGEKYIASLMKLSVRENDVDQETVGLLALAAGLADSDVREYVEEAVKCLNGGSLRAATVFLWAGAVRTLQEKCVVADLAGVNISMNKRDAKARVIRTVDDFQYFKDKELLQAAEDIGVLDKAQRTTLSEGLDLRNRCGHPNKYRPGIKKAASFIEDLVGVVFR